MRNRQAKYQAEQYAAQVLEDHIDDLIHSIPEHQSDQNEVDIMLIKDKYQLIIDHLRHKVHHRQHYRQYPKR